MLGEISLTGLSSQGQLATQLHSWKVGQVLEAIALSRPAAERLQLRIGGMELEARTQVPIQPGDRVLLKVLSAGSTPTLQVVPATTASANAADVVNHAIRQLLPRQLSTDKVMNKLVSILKSDAKLPQLPIQTRGLIETLLARIPTAEKLADQAQLRQLVSESGLFREARQLVGGQADLKQSLIQLARQLSQVRTGDRKPAGSESQSVQPQRQAVSSGGSDAAVVSGAMKGAAGLVGQTQTGTAQSKAQGLADSKVATTAAEHTPHRPTTGEVAQQVRQVIRPESRLPAAQLELMQLEELLTETRRVVDGGIARIVLQQAQSLPVSEQGNLRWVLELPWREGEEFHRLPMVIEREAKREDSDSLEPGWRVELKFNLPELGSVQARILVRGEKVSASLWAERDSTAQLADSALPVLETALLAAGLEVGALTCLHGQRDDADSGHRPRSVLDCRV